MKQYIGTKIIKAKPATNIESAAIKSRCDVEAVREEYVKAKIPEREGYHVVYADDYESWSPKDVFEAAYRPCENMTFGLAIEALKKGHKVARKGWNGQGMWLYLSSGSKVFYTDLKEETKKGLRGNRCVDGNGFATINSHIDMSAADGSVVIGWSPSQTDILAEDWYIVD